MSSTSRDVRDREMEKIQNDFNCLFFQSGKNSNDKALISINMLTIWKKAVCVFNINLQVNNEYSDSAND